MRTMLVMLMAAATAGGLGAARGCAARESLPAPVARDVWVDATGREVAPAGALWHVDWEGRVYYLSPETGQPLDLYDNLAAHAGYERADCEGPLLVGHLVPPRMPFSLGDGRGYRVRPDDARTAPASFQSRLLPSGECEVYAIPQDRPAAFEAPPPSLPGLPTLPYLGPLHVERRP